MRAGSCFAQIRDSLTAGVGPEKARVALLDYINEPVTKSEVLFKRVSWLKGYLTFDLFQDQCVLLCRRFRSRVE